MSAAAELLDVPVEAVQAELETLTRQVSRRRFLAASAAVGTGLAMGSTARRALAAARRGSPPLAPRVAIVGAGLAGLRCGHLLWTGQPRRRVRATIYEGHADRIGGRCWTLRDFFSNGLIIEHGGAFLDSNQFTVLRLAAQLGLELEDYSGGELPGLPEVYWFDGAYYTYAEASADWETVGFPAFHVAVNEAATTAATRATSPRWT